jgi:3-methyl-2-oxobutanoate hydroxymethyltransferase
MGTVTIPALQQMKRDGRKIVGVVVYDYQMAQIVDRAGVDIVSVGDSVGVNMWGQQSELDITLDQMLLACKAVRRGVERALVSCDFPYGPLQAGTDAAVRAATYLMENGGADMLKLDAASEYPDAVRVIASAGIPVWAQFGMTPQSNRGKGEGGRGKGKGVSGKGTDELVADAKLLEQAGAVMLDFTHSGPIAGPAVTAAVSIPVIGGLGGGPWLDGRVRAVVNAIGYMATALDDTTERYANVARTTLDAVKMYAEDVRAARQIRGEPALRASLATPKPNGEGRR